MINHHTSPGFIKTVLVLLGAARTRANGRSRRQSQLLKQRASNNAMDWRIFGLFIAALIFAFVNAMAVFSINMAIKSAQCLEAESNGKIVVRDIFLNRLKTLEKGGKKGSVSLANSIEKDLYKSEVKKRAERTGEPEEVIIQRLKMEISSNGSANFISWHKAAPGLKQISITPLPRMIGSMMLFLWVLMLVFQGEGLELDIQRRKHPMWEWLFTHPVQPGAVFLAEMLTPIAANPIYWSAPLFAGFLFGSVYGFFNGFLALFIIGIPSTIALACLGKALEIGVMLRFSPRTRGAMISLMSWLGYFSMVLIFLSIFIEKIFPVLVRFINPLLTLPWSWLPLFLGGKADGSFSFTYGIFTCLACSVIITAGATWFSAWAAQKGLGGNNSSADSSPSRSKNRVICFGKEPLYRKEFLWFTRDRGAIIQAILIPVTVAASQAFNFRFLIKHAQDSWNFLCGVAILFGTYFLWILGPRSLTSEGSALWISLTWPRGMESLLKAKAWLWSLISTVLVGLIMLYGCYLFPENIWKIVLVAIGWYFFSRSMAEKSVTLVTVASSSGEHEKIPFGRRWATSLGMLTFAIGVITGQWHLAIIGIVFSYITAAAMWQNFRARLPFLYDRWSEKLPPPPTLMHAMIAITLMVELTALFSIPFSIFAQGELLIARSFSYILCAGIISFFMSSFLGERGVRFRDIFYWEYFSKAKPTAIPENNRISIKIFSTDILSGAAVGLVLGLIGMGYMVILMQFPETAELLEKSQAQFAKNIQARYIFASIAICIAPFAEEYLFRGLLYKALDREWGGWRAVAGSATFFAIYHSPLSWIPVAMVGVSCAILFKKTGNLGSAMALHLVYNAVVSLI